MALCDSLFFPLKLVIQHCDSCCPTRTIRKLKIATAKQMCVYIYVYICRSFCVSVCICVSRRWYIFQLIYIIFLCECSINFLWIIDYHSFECMNHSNSLIFSLNGSFFCYTPGRVYAENAFRGQTKTKMVFRLLVGEKPVFAIVQTHFEAPKSVDIFIWNIECACARVFVICMRLCVCVCVCDWQAVGLCSDISRLKWLVFHQSTL